MTIMSVVLALVVGVATLHDIRHVFQVAKVIHRYRLPLCVLSTLAVVIRQPLMWWAYLDQHPWLTMLAAGLGQTIIVLVYRIDLETVRRASEIAEGRRQRTQAPPNEEL